MLSSSEARNSPNEVRMLNISNDKQLQDQRRPARWSMGILNDPTTHDVPGTILLLTENFDAPNSIKTIPESNSVSSPNYVRQNEEGHEKKKTPDGKIVLDPQPDDCCNDPLNWKIWRKDAALLSIGLYCMVGGGMTPALAAGFSDVASTFNVDITRVSLTTGLYMLGLGIGSVVSSPTAILFGKRPVYLLSSIIFVVASIWCAVSSNFTSLILARVLQGISVSPTECLPSATISEIFFLHERAYRIGIYSLLLLSGKNLVPLVSAIIIQSLSWRWVFWIVVMCVVSCGILLFFFVPETFWDRRNSFENSNLLPSPRISSSGKDCSQTTIEKDYENVNKYIQTHIESDVVKQLSRTRLEVLNSNGPSDSISINSYVNQEEIRRVTKNFESGHSANGIITKGIEKSALNYVDQRRANPNLSYAELLKPWNGRLTYSSWLQVSIRPFILYKYPAILWSSIVYSCSIGWLIVISEAVTLLFRSKATYGFSAMSAGLLYISPFIGSILGTAVAGKLSDLIVRCLAKRNNNIFEPEFRLLMATPTAITTVIGLMGLGWSIQVGDSWIIPTLFFGIVSFGCSLGAATAIAFCVDSYRTYAGEALVTLNFSKNIFHGLVFSLFITNWINDRGPKMVFMWLGIVQLILMAFTIPMYIFGKRARLWTLRKNFMRRF